MSIRRSHAKGREEFLIGAAWESTRQHYFERIKPDHTKAVEANGRANWYWQRAMDIQQ